MFLLEGVVWFNEIILFFVDVLCGVLGIGLIYVDLILGYLVLVYVVFVCVLLIWWVLYCICFGLWLCVVGENLVLVDMVGVLVMWMCFFVVLICGVLCGMVGVYFVIGILVGFVKEMLVGCGYIVLVVLIFVKWWLWSVFGVIFLFGLLEVLVN